MIGQELVDQAGACYQLTRFEDTRPACLAGEHTVRILRESRLPCSLRPGAISDCVEPACDRGGGFVIVFEHFSKFLHFGRQLGRSFVALVLARDHAEIIVHRMPVLRVEFSFPVELLGGPGRVSGSLERIDLTPAHEKGTRAMRAQYRLPILAVDKRIDPLIPAFIRFSRGYATKDQVATILVRKREGS